MIKKYKWRFIISSAAILLPALLWLILEDKITLLGKENYEGLMDTRFLFPICLISVILLAFHWIMLIFTVRDNQRVQQSEKIIGISFAIIPVVNLVVCGIFLLIAIGHTVNIISYVAIFFGILFVLMGNYMPKCRRNRTIGIKIKWTLANDDNWRVTHRFAGIMWTVGGLAFMFCAFLPERAFFAVMIPYILVIATAPAVFSYCYYRNQVKGGTYTEDHTKFSEKSKGEKRMAVTSMIAVAVILVICVLLLFTGNVSFTVGEESLNATATYWTPLSVDYDDVESIEYRAEGVSGRRISGFGTPRLFLGLFSSDEIGNHLRYESRGGKAVIILKLTDKTVVLGCHTDEETAKLYDQLLQKLDK